MLRIVATVTAIAVGATLAYAQNVNAVKERREAMRTIAKAGSNPFKMLKGETPFDIAAVQGVLKSVQDVAPKFKTLFPDDAKTGLETAAAPAIWAKRAEFNAAIDKWINDAKAAATAIKDEATFKAEYPKVAANCGGCHKAEGGFAPALSESFKAMQKPL